VGALLVARGGLTWTLVADPTMRASRVLIQLRDFVPTGAIMAAVVMFVLVPPADDTAFIGAGFIRAVLVGGVVAAGIRQVLLKVYERRANEAERAAEERLAVEIRDRERVSRALAELEPGSSAAETAMGICTRCLELPGVGFAIVTGVDGSGEYTPIAAAGLDPHGLVGRRLSSEHAAHLTEGIAQGAWREAASPWLDAWVDPGGGAEVARVALRLEDHVIGVLTMGCRNHLDPAGIARRLSTVREIGVVAAALLGPALAADEAYRARRAAIDRVIEDQAFYPVYQPIVDLASGAVRGFEALTRFTDGTRPDLRFIEASAVGLGVELEIATLEAAAKGAASLPADCYLSVNLSPEIATRPEMLGPTLTRLPRDVLLELTEHVPVEDYESLMGCIYALDLRVRIAVDDAGSGYAGLQHILAVRPHVVKLDIALIRSVDIDLARQALVGSMVSFASMTGAVVVAEGVETEAEARMLQGLGVALGQGYFFGRPERAPALTDAFATAGG
jgi:EAL domain-containing protein (putative c-di-GMP-specific phosphodiesterase class I)